MKPAPAFSGAILAGGQSRRMGQDKALLTFGRETLLERQAALLQRAGAGEILLASGPGQRFNLLENNGLWRQVPDTVPDSGPLAGIAACLAAARASHLLVVAVDMPRLTPELLQELLGLGEPGCGVVPVIDGQFEPLAAIYPLGILPMAVERLAARQLALQPFAAAAVAAGRLKPWLVPPAKRGLFDNWNTPASLPAPDR